MKRIAIKLVVFLLLGAVVNVAVAWGCALWSTAHVSRRSYGGAPIPERLVDRWRVWSAPADEETTSLEWTLSAGPGVSENMVYAPLPIEMPKGSFAGVLHSDHLTLGVREYRWPLRALSGGSWYGKTKYLEPLNETPKLHWFLRIDGSSEAEPNLSRSPARLELSVGSYLCARWDGDDPNSVSTGSTAHKCKAQHNQSPPSFSSGIVIMNVFP